MKRSIFVIPALLIALFSASLPIVSQAELPPVVDGKPLPSLAPMLNKVLPTVVNVSTVGIINSTSSNDSDSKQSGPHKVSTLGSGVIVDAQKGYIITNAHVIKGAATVTVTLNNGTQRVAKVIGIDSPSDVAVLQIPAQNLAAIPFANSDALKVGDFAVAIGNPFGLNQTVTSGIISALQRTDLGIEGYENFIQTDASINPGNSGGALVNLNGQLVGINTAILAPDGGNIGIGFAIPSNMIKSIMDQLIQYGSVRRGLLGIMIQSLTPALADAFDIPNKTGVVVTQVNSNSPAAKAGIETGDVVESVDGQTVTDAVQITNIIGLLRVGTTVNVTVLRNNKTMTFPIIITSPREYIQNSQANNPLLFGLNIRDFNQLTTLHGAVAGVQITGIAEESPAWRAAPLGLRPGDVIISANMKPVANVDQLMNVAKSSKQLLLNVLRGDGAMFVVIK